MPSKNSIKKPAPATAKKAKAAGDVADVVAMLKDRGSQKTKDGMARYGIPSDRAFGVPVGVLKQIAKALGKSHALAEALWRTGHYEARMLATFVDEAERVTLEQMERWCRGFDSWAICDTACFALFDRTPHAFVKITAWAKSDAEFVKRAAFALLASSTVHAKNATDADFLRCRDALRELRSASVQRRLTATKK